jgi:outer membrane protein assembly factor BamB
LKVNDYSGDSLGTGGNVYAYNVTNGHLIFDYTSGSFGYNGYWINILTGIGEEAAGNLYTYGSEHSPGPNLEPGELLGAINATTGQPVWNITFWANGVKVADNYAVALNNYDGQIYAFSKGPTQTTVQTPLAGVTMGQPLSGTRHNNGHFAWH